MTTSAKALYTALSSERSSYVTRAQLCAALTIPSLFPLEGSKGEHFVAPYQGVGARAVKSLASKIFMALFPPETPFFRLKVDPTELANLSGATQGKVEEGLSKLERMIVDALEARTIRPSAYEGIKQLIVAGNVLFHLGKERVRIFRLDRYVVRRDPMGLPLDIIVEEDYQTSDLEEEIRNSLDAESARQKTVKLYTWVRRTEDGWESEQYVEEVLVPGSKSTYAEGRCPWLPLRMIQVAGEDYGRSYVEEHVGDLQSLESLAKSMNQGAKAAARIVFLVRPNGVTNVKALNEAENGGFVPGNPDDIHCVQLDKHADLAVAKAEADEIRTGIAQAFLMTASIQRKGDRVTAEEIRTLAGELEQVLGGVYSLLSVEFQAPLVGVTIGRLEAEGAIPQFPEGTFRPAIITGTDALGRGQDLQRLVTAMNAMAPMGAPALGAIDMGEMWKRVLAALGVEEKGLIKTQEQLQAENQQAQAAALLEKLGPEALKMSQQQGQKT